MTPHAYHPPPDTGIAVLYIDDDLLAIDKPSGLLSVPGRGETKQDCLITRVHQAYPEALVVHRLDMETSGILLLARNPYAQRQLGLAFQAREIRKRYIALVDGQVSEQHGEINLPLICDWPHRPRQKVDHDIGKPSLTRYRRLAYNPPSNSSRLELEPVTGRTHQLRVHLSALGHAILGDPLYASETISHAAPRLMLHASQIVLPHPVRGEEITITLPAPF